MKFVQFTTKGFERFYWKNHHRNYVVRFSHDEMLASSVSSEKRERRNVDVK